ncbi:MAG: hypothetical protein IIB87_08230, partial [Chloroflexi bacterium]|nr:hypothetical protein [Chloroflexota bacterium]
DGTLGPEQVVDSRVCECCQTDAVRTTAGDVIAVYRDRSPLEVRDIGIARVSGGKISDPEILHADNWRIKGCPVNGPAIDSLGTTVAVAWFTQSSLSSTHVRLVISRDGGRSFGEPISIDEGHPLGRVAAVVAAREGQTPTLEELVDHCRTHVAGYKVPRELHLVDQIQRQPSGKPNYKWAKAIALGETAGATGTAS